MSELPQPGADAAWFFDFDGTLVDLAQTPDAVRAPDDLVPVIGRLLELNVAVAIVSGRPLAEIDAFLAPLQLPAAGVHGSERRDALGQIHHIPVPDLNPAIEALRALCGTHPDLLCEVKPGALALHYRRVPHLGPLCLDAMEQAAQAVTGMTVLRGKMVAELKSAQADKGAAVRAFLAEPPFRGRRPWYFGDDVTDESAFAAVQDQGGVAVKLGEGDSVAAHRLDGPAALREWLDHAAAELTRARQARGTRETRLRRTQGGSG